MTKRTIFNKHFLHYFYLDRDIKKAVERYSYTDGWTLDAGCGESPYKEIFCYYMGIDISFGHDIKDIKHPDNRFDNVFCSQVLEHVDDYMKAISEIRRVLKPKGILILSVPFTWQLHGEPNDYRRFTPYGIKEMLKGFTIIETKANGGKWATIGQLLINSMTTSNKILRWVTKILIPFINSFFLFLDTINKDETLTQNYVTVAYKNQ